MNKKYAIVSVVVILILAGVVYWYSQPKKSGVEVNTGTSTEAVIPSTSNNPLDNKPNLNPVDQTNPFKNLKTNPFE